MSAEETQQRFPTWTRSDAISCFTPTARKLSKLVFLMRRLFAVRRCPTGLMLCTAPHTIARVVDVGRNVFGPLVCFASKMRSCCSHPARPLRDAPSDVHQHRLGIIAQTLFGEMARPTAIRSALDGDTFHSPQTWLWPHFLNVALSSGVPCRLLLILHKMV